MVSDMATLGYSPDELAGNDAFELIHPSDREGVKSVFSEMLANPSIDREVEYRIRASDGEYRWTEARGSNYPDDPLINGVMVTIRDVTERKHREEELEGTNELLDEFARVVSHDVATPLGVIENKARLIEITQDTSHAADIYEATERVQSLIDDLEALAREGKQVGDVGTVGLASVARDAWEMIESPHGELVVEDSTVIDADRGRLQQLLENLLVNAVEHSDHDDTSVAISDGSGQRRRSTTASEPAQASTPGVTIRVGTFSEGFWVADDGPGIRADDRETVFEQGYTTADEGTGLGLAIVKRFVDGHGWTVTVTDSETGGARFEVWTNGRPGASKSGADTDISGS
jgi:PAS domain S-box-containing protein